ncbi:DUF4105 domain-containing protein [Bdellovibrio sp. HCB337]|uniref:DUF7844 domain-containing protein n=1 Tax=Bdellovibrio sp. HCB337 TaxID=3394358 RepID=UPI0039A54216
MLKWNLRTAWTYGFLSASLLFSDAALAGIYQLKTELPPQEKVAVLALLDKAESMLPPNLKAAVKSIDVKIDEINLMAPPGSGKQVIAGITKRGTITINKSYLGDIVAGPERARQTPQRQHKNAFNEALATVLHESTHVYDELNVHSSEEHAWIMRCKANNFETRSMSNKTSPPPCAAYRGMYRTFSQNPYFESVAGWVHGQETNGYTQRSPDIYENKDSYENFAVNMEFFLMDPDYKCRRPNMYRLLKDHFQHEPFAGANCKNSFGYVLPAQGMEKPQMLSIDPSRVYQVHYLLADVGSGAGSGWGHAMIRLVICEPGKAMGPDCVKDIFHSVVLSYRAFIDSVGMSPLDGLTGKYPSRLFIIPMSQVINEYARDELRPLYSIPLKLSRKEIESFVVRSLESHWSYDGKYRFVSNNCATETFNLIKSALLRPDFMFADIKEVSERTQVDNMNPLGLRPLLKKVGLSDETVFSNSVKALNQGYYFDSFEDRYTKIFSLLKRDMNLPFSTFKEYIELTATQRRVWLERLTKTNPRVSQIAAGFLLFENASARRLERKVRDEVFKVVLEEVQRDNESGREGRSSKVVNGGLRLSKLFATPANFLRNQSGYGLPMSAELQTASQEIKKQVQASAALAKEASGMVDSMIQSTVVQEVENIKENKQYLQSLLGK